jgi:hypothetical protein
VRHHLVRPTMVHPPLLCRIHCVRAGPTAPVPDPSRHSPPGHHAPTSNAPRRVRIECTLPRPLLHLPRRLAPPAAPVGERERGAIDAGPIGFPSDMATSQGPWLGPRTEARRGATFATPNPSRIGQTSRIPLESNFYI